MLESIRKKKNRWKKIIKIFIFVFVSFECVICIIYYNNRLLQSTQFQLNDPRTKFTIFDRFQSSSTK